MAGRHLLIADGMYRNTPLRLINVYAPTVKSEWLAVLRPLLLASSRLVILAGDFNCIIDANGQSGGASSKPDAMSRFLIETIKDARYTWSRPDGSIRSRIDFLLVSRVFSVRSTNVKPVFVSDHYLLLATYRMTGG
eukprot:g33101.t1